MVQDAKESDATFEKVEEPKKRAKLEARESETPISNLKGKDPTSKNTVSAGSKKVQIQEASAEPNKKQISIKNIPEDTKMNDETTPKVTQSIIEQDIDKSKQLSAGVFPKATPDIKIELETEDHAVPKVVKS